MTVERSQVVLSDAAEFVKKKLVGGRFQFGTAGAGLSWDAFGDSAGTVGASGVVMSAMKAAAGIESEQRTSAAISEWIASASPVGRDRLKPVLVDSIHISGYGRDEAVDASTGYVKGGDTDHAVIFPSLYGQPARVLAIDTKRWRKHFTYNIEPASSRSSGDAVNVLSAKRGKFSTSPRAFQGGRLNISKCMWIWNKYFHSLAAGSVISSDVAVSSVIVVDDVVAEGAEIIRDEHWNDVWSKQRVAIITTSQLPAFLDAVYSRVRRAAAGASVSSLGSLRGSGGVVERDLDEFSALVASVATEAIKPLNPAMFRV